ncbi:MAG: pyridoxal phosphate-dependent aminotransferase [Myxococcota bacterium]|nr:pyridoxal phosphate-dependent aminotransferase [Myxococcota bacterium]
MIRLAAHLNKIKPSATLAVSLREAALKAQGVAIIPLSAGEPDFDTPTHIVDAAKTALDRGVTRYTPVTGMPLLRQAIAQESAQVRQVPCAPENTIVTVGAKHSLYNFFAAVLDPGDEVIIPAPYWVSYPDQVLLSGGQPVIVETREADGFVLKPGDFNKALTARTKVLVLNTPSNPSGAIYPPEAVAAITEAATEAGVYVLCDEIYRDLIYDGAIHTSPLTVVPENRRDLIFVVDGVSKNYAMTGWRIGWGIGHPDIIKAMAKIQGQSTSNPASMAQAGALAAITGPKLFLDDWRRAYQLRRDAIVAGLNQLPDVRCPTPGGAFYVLPSVKDIIKRMGQDATDLTLAKFLLEEAAVACVPGTPFGAPGHLRLSYATSIEAIHDGLRLIAAALARI